jgi:hypothetical protein
MDEFKTAFGDMFVRSFNTGGEFDVVARITSVDEQHQSAQATSLHGEYNGLLASGSFQTAFNTATKDTDNRTEVTVFVSQAGGIGGQASFTGPDATKILQRLNDFPQAVHDHPVGYEVELANYNTIPIPVPTAEEREDREIVLKDCFAQKMGFLKDLSDLSFVLSENADLFFDNLPPKETLVEWQGEYRTALNGLMAHAIRVSTGKMDPPQLFKADPAPHPLNFQKKPFNAPQVNVPDWVNVYVQWVTVGGTEQDGTVHKSAAAIGLKTAIVTIPNVPGRGGDIAYTEPKPGVPVPTGTVVTLYVYDDDQ